MKDRRGLEISITSLFPVATTNKPDAGSMTTSKPRKKGVDSTSQVNGGQGGHHETLKYKDKAATSLAPSTKITPFALLGLVTHFRH